MIYPARVPIASAQTWRIGHADLEIFQLGPAEGVPLLVLHDLDYVNGVDYPYIASLARRRRIAGENCQS